MIWLSVKVVASKYFYGAYKYAWSNWLHLFSFDVFIFFFLFSLQKLSILCFRHEHHSPETPKPEAIDHFLHEELVQSESKDINVPKRDWKSVLQKVMYSLVIWNFEYWHSYQWIYVLPNKFEMCIFLSLSSGFMVMKFQAKFTYTYLQWFCIDLVSSLLTSKRVLKFWAM